VSSGNQALPAGVQRSAITTASGPATSALWLPGQRDGLREGILAGGLSWALPDDASCASTARKHVRQTLAGLHLPAGLIDDAAVAVSELATNAWLHALDARPVSAGSRPGGAAPELWVYRRGAPQDAELVCGVFDARRDAWPRARRGSFTLLPDDTDLADPQLAAVLADNAGNGHGLGIVAALSAATGWHRTRSRLAADPVPGKVTWFAMTIPRSSLAAQPPSVHLTPAQAAHALIALLTARGLREISHRHDTTRAAVSVTASLVVRCQDGIFQWPAQGTLRRRAYFDLADTTEDIIRLHEETAMQDAVSLDATGELRLGSPVTEAQAAGDGSLERGPGDREAGFMPPGSHVS
jgi:hypothetical protein